MQAMRKIKHDANSSGLDKMLTFMFTRSNVSSTVATSKDIDQAGVSAVISIVWIKSLLWKSDLGICLLMSNIWVGGIVADCLYLLGLCQKWKKKDTSWQN